MSSEIPTSAYFGLDFETFGTRDLPTVGLDNYLADPEFKPLLAAVSWDFNAARSLVFDFVCDPFAENNFNKFLSEREVYAIAHNASFERGVLKRSFPRYHIEVSDSAVASRCAGGDSKLKNAGPQLLGIEKFEVGERLIKKFSVGDTPPTAEQVSDDPDWQLFKEYCVQDARISYLLNRECHLEYAAKERLFERQTSQMNALGWPVDIPLVCEMQTRYLANQEKALREFQERYDPNGELNLNSPLQLKRWCGERGIRASSFDKEAVPRMIAAIRKKMVSPTLPLDKLQAYDEVLAMLELKQTLGGSSLKKLKVILEKVSEDGRLRDQYLHCGASQTRRTSGMGVQMQNLKQLGPHPDNVEELKDPSIHWSNDMMADNLRQCFTSSHPKGALIVGDFSSVESRGLAYIANEEWKLEEYRKGRDMYAVLAQKIFGIPDYDSIRKSSPERRAGKVGELSCGYGAGAGAVLSMAKKLSIDMSEAQAQNLVRDWRSVNPKIVTFWAELEQRLNQAFTQGSSITTIEPGESLGVAIMQTHTPGSLQEQHPGAQSMRVEVFNSDLPSRTVFSRIFHGCYRRGKNLCYYKPNAVNGRLWSTVYRDPTTKQLRHYDLYGGKLAGILTQSFCRELFFNCLTNLSEELQNSGVEIIGQFHDEIVLNWDPSKAEIPLHEACKILGEQMSDPGKFKKFPLTAEVKYDYRYIK